MKLRSMRLLAAISAPLLLLAACAANAWGLTFHEAMSGGHISCSSAYASSGYTEATLTVRNTRTYSVTGLSEMSQSLPLNSEM